MKITAAEVLLKMIRENGTETIFGYPGAAIAPVYQALKKEPIRHILTRTEQGAAHMAAAFYRSCGKTGVCLATSGPGSTNLLTAIANAYVDSVPLVVITAQVSVSQIGTDAFQEVDTTGVTAPVTKHNYLIKSAEDLPKAVQEAFYLASDGRPGPVVVDIPYDVLKAKMEWEPSLPYQTSKLTKPALTHNNTLDDLVLAVATAKNPLLVVGGGVLCGQAQRELMGLLSATGLPTVSTMMGLSALPSDFPNYLGMVGIHGLPAANAIFKEADLVIFAGSRITERTVPDPVQLTKRAVTIHIDIDPAELGKNCPCQISLCGDVKTILQQLTDALQNYRIKAHWQKTISFLQGTNGTDTGSRPSYVDPAYLLSVLRKALTGPSIIATEVGQHQIWACRHFSFRKGDVFLTSGGFGAMGYGLPAAIGAGIVAGDRPIIALEGDGSLQMSMPELATMVETGVPVKIILFKNSCLGLVREVDKVSCRADYVRLGDLPDFCTLATAYGIPSQEISKNEDVADALTALLTASGPYFLEVVIDPKAHV
ncbi:MAG: biosynthetic-type acetolactate synthase large subunit [Ruminococcaceae bacterium]|nr:biosynthetic-type acetolactate synthase large subunit [Oscillospiraceae bacterium]